MRKKNNYKNIMELNEIFGYATRDPFLKINGLIKQFITAF